MAEKLDYTIQIDEQEYDVTAADALHADLANQVEKALIVKESVRKNLDYKELDSDTELKDIESLIVDDLQADIEPPNTTIGVVDSRDTRDSENNGHSFAYKGDFDTTLEVVPSSGGVFTGPIYAPDIDAGDGFNINKFQVTNYNSVDTIIRELKGFPVYEWTGTQVRALTEGTPPAMLPFKVILYTGPMSGDEDYWTETARANLRLVNCAPDGITTDCTTDGNFFLINAKAGHLDCGRILLGTFDHTKTANCSTYVELRVKEADHADNATNADTLDTTDGIGSVTQPIYLDAGVNGGVATACYERAGGTAVTLNGNKKFEDETVTDETTTAASFYAPIAAGETGQVLLSNGDETDKTPTWASQNTLSVKDAQNVTTSIDGMALETIFVHKDKDGDKKFDSGSGELYPKVQNAAHADNADNVTSQIDGLPLNEIFVYKDNTPDDGITNPTITSQIQSAEKADKLYIYSAGGTGTTAQEFTERHDSYIIYSHLGLPGSTITDGYFNGIPHSDLNREGNIFIKLEP